MLKTILIPLVLPLLMLFSNGSDNSIALFKQNTPPSPESETGTLEKMMVADGSITMDIDLPRLNGIGSTSQMNSLRFAVAPNSFFTILVFNKDLRGPDPGSMALIPQSPAVLPAALGASSNQLVIEKTGWTEPFDIVVRDGKTGFTFFNIEGNLYDYDAKTQLLSIKEGRLLVSEEFAAKLGRPAEAGSVVGKISITATMRSIEITQVVNGEAKSVALPAPLGALVPGPDVIVGSLPSLQQFGSSGSQVGLAVATDSCNAGDVELNWFQLPNNDHPVIPQNLYRMSGGATNDERFEQVGQSWLKHAFTALQQDICGFGCQSSGTGTRLGTGCSDPYSANLNASQSGLGSRAWVNPFSGAYPRGDSGTSPRDHTGHTHTGTSHRILVATSDLNTTLNPGATYYAEAQYVTPHEYAWCQSHPGQCNMYNNASYRRFNVSGTSSFSFSPVGSTVQTKSAIVAWTGSTTNSLEPAPGGDGVAYVSYKVTNPSPGVWHYEYAVYNQNLDRAIQSFSVPLPPGISISNFGFHAPPQHPAFANDGTVGGAGYSSTPWTPTQTSDSLTWNSETFAQNPNANAIRWGTLYNFRFDSDRPPQTTNATVGFFKTGAPMSVQIQGPSGAEPTPTPTPTPTPQPSVGLQYYPLPNPVRLLDTRPGQSACDTPGVPLTGGGTRTEAARVACTGIPSSALVVVGNATVVNSEAGAGSGFITLYPSGATQPTVSNLNYVAGQVVPNAFTVGLGSGDGAFNIFTTSSTHFIVDVTGYYAPPAPGGLFYHSLPNPVRLLDTRPGELACDTPGTPLTGGGTRTEAARIACTGIPSSALVVVGNATVVNSEAGAGSGFITLYPSGATQPTVSNLNYVAGQVVPNAFTVGLGNGDGAFNIFASSSTHFNVDVTGYYSDQATDVNGAGLLYYPLPNPVRLLDTRPGQSACDTPGVPLTGNATRTQPARTVCSGVASNALVVVGNATVVNSEAGAGSGFITLYPSGAAQPTVSNLNYVTGQVVPNAFTVGLGSSDGAFGIFASSSTHFIADLTGYFAP